MAMPGQNQPYLQRTLFIPQQPMPNGLVANVAPIVPAYPQQVYVQVAPAPVAGVNVIPDTITVNQRLSTGKGAVEGMKYGLVYSALATLPILGLEKLFKADNLAMPLSRAFGRELAPAKGFWPSLARSAPETFFVGVTGGAILGAWFVSHTKKRLKEISEAQQQQMQGTFTPKAPTLLQQWGVKEKPVQNPQADYQQLIQQQLGPSNAFKYGMKLVFIQKVVLGIIPTLLAIAGISLAYKKNPQAVAEGLKIYGVSTPKEFAKVVLHPVLLVKLAALPFIGGFIALKLAPWMKRQLGIAG